MFWQAWFATWISLQSGHWKNCFKCFFLFCFLKTDTLSNKYSWFLLFITACTWWPTIIYWRCYSNNYHMAGQFSRITYRRSYFFKCFGVNDWNINFTKLGNESENCNESLAYHENNMYILNTFLPFCHEQFGFVSTAPNKWQTNEVKQCTVRR